MDFKERIRRVRNLTCFYQYAICDMVEYYADMDKCLIRIHKGETYVVAVGHAYLEYVSNGTDHIVVYADELREMR